MCLGGEDIQKLVGGFSNPTPFGKKYEIVEFDHFPPTKLQWK